MHLRMDTFWKAVAGGLLVTLLGLEADGQGDRLGNKTVSGSLVFYLGQERDIWRPLIHTAIDLNEINSFKSTFQLRTFDPEGVIFYGDNKNGEDWFVLALKDGIPLMQISREGMLVSVAGGPKLNDGKWHTLEVSNQGKFVVLDVDGSSGLVVGMQPKQEEVPLTGKLRLALGGVLVDTKKLIVQFVPQMDACVREGNWLNTSVPWEVEVEELRPCYQNVRPGSYFPGTGLAVFNTSDFPIKADGGVKFELWGDFHKMDGTIISIKAPGQPLLFTLASSNNTKEVTLSFYDKKLSLKDSFTRLAITFQTGQVQVIQDGDDLKTAVLPTSPTGQLDYLTSWRESLIAFGGLLGDDENHVGSHFLTGCLDKIQVQGQDLDLDLAVKHTSISSHSCPS